MKYKNLTLIGTSHIARESLRAVSMTIEEESPDIIAIELDSRRLQALMQKKRRSPRLSDIWRVGIKGFLFSIIGAWAEAKLGEAVGVKPGSEMLLAVELARKKSIPVALIDQDIEITLKRFSREMSWKEKWFFVVDVIKAVVFRKKEVSFDLRTVPSQKIINELVGKVKRRYPNIYKVLVTERNDVMANNLQRIMLDNPDKKVLGIIGAGHEKEMISIIRRLSSLNKSLGKSAGKTSVQYRFTVEA